MEKQAEYVTEAAVPFRYCERCGVEFEAKTWNQKYCSKVCSEFAAVERKYGVQSTHGIVCTCGAIEVCKDIERRSDNVWRVITEKGFGVRVGFRIYYCPFCGGELV